MKWLLPLLVLCLPLTSQAHPADVTPLKVKVEKNKLEFRFTLNLFMLGKMVKLDTDEDLRLTASELEAAKPELTLFLRDHLLLRLNEKTAKLGGIAQLEPLWPSAESVDVREVERAVDVTFILPWPEIIANVWMEFTGFPQWGELATIQATYEQGDLRMQVPFSQTEPDYLYDTGFGAEEIFQTPPAKSAPTTPMWAVYAFETFIFIVLLKAFFSFFLKPTKG
ncbi:hypothetical protein [Prosthecobacter dejongeii]|uniref:Transmembrane protein n=1 Tax=Prosthecobacter dejongeii TaxID=48465 RepID=A0A7W7YIV2_9BACT|nr:hypothetical protein [Prosthecobacter dejongeii]MBB5036862.1 hypothetical protein [Prosthecobacter dejongeii]